MNQRENRDEQPKGRASAGSAQAEALHGRAVQTLLQLERRYGDRRSVAAVRDVLLLDRAVVAIHRLVWGLEPRRGHLRPANVLLFLAALAASLTVAAVVSSVVEASAWLWLAAAPLAAISRAAIRLGLSLRLPGRDRQVTALLPGAIVVGVGFLAVNVFTQLVVVWIGSTREDTYGALGLAATILFSFWLTSRVIVVSVVANAAFWSRRRLEIAGPSRR